MIFTDRTIIVQKGISSINDTIILYRGDKGVEIRFTLNEGSPFRFGSGASPNIIEKTEAAYGQLVIKTPNDLPAIFSEVVPTNEGKIVFTITGEMIDEITEVGYYTFQIRLFDENQQSRATIPEVINGIEIREPIAAEDANEVGAATVGTASTTAGTAEDAFDEQGNYNKTTWKTKDRITAAKLNKIEAGIDGVNQKVTSNGTASNITITDTGNYFTNSDVEGALQEVGSQIKDKAKKSFDSIKSMKDCQSLKVGDTIQTLGYYKPHDGGNATYEIVSGTFIDDGGSFIELKNGLFAKLSVNTLINVKQFGAYGNGVNDDTNAIQNAIDFSYENGNKQVYISNGIYNISKALFLYEKCKMIGENEQTTTIIKNTNTKSNISNFDYDALIILTNRNFDTNETRSQQIKCLTLEGNQKNKIDDKDEPDMQYAILSPYGSPKLIIEKFKILNVDVGIQSKTMWMSAIRDSEWLHAHYRGIYVKSKTQGLNLEKLNIDGSTVAGVDISGGVYSTLSNVLVEYIYEGVAYRFDSWGGRLINCGYEKGWGPETGFQLKNSHVKLSGCYFGGVTTKEDGITPSKTDCTMIELVNSSMEVDTSNFGYDLHGKQYDGKLAYISNSHLKIDDSNTFNCSFKNDVVGANDYAYLTSYGKTVELKTGSVAIGEYNRHSNFIDKDLNNSPKHINKNIYCDSINTPTTNTKGDYSWGRAYRKGDIGTINNPLVNGKAFWICNRDNNEDTPLTVGTITEVNAGSLVLSDITLENYDTTGVRIYPSSTIKGVTSSATCNVASVDKATNTIALGTYKTGTFVVGEKLQLNKSTYAKDSDYLYVGFIHSGKTAERPKTSLVVGQMYFDTNLNKPIWYKGNNQWVDSTGNIV